MSVFSEWELTGDGTGTVSSEVQMSYVFDISARTHERK